ncbi:thiamine-monophosphate kinase [Methanolinea mesophila]|uniref:thiamine-phosphate kinase n=1 Tax=Methanolinea mesophila TaxID=547055 RepID=UPI001AE6A75F|nr:thiamine-phosphate kinase [Methanolinea mesophila]MBP1929331.1 thiamine-monophosphate kinase [Methanolinea mesophila]
MDDRELLREVMEIVGKECCLDDCAVIPAGERYLVASTDMLHRKTDFPERMSEWQIGWTSVAVTLSDIAAMGARPCFVLLAVGLDANTAIAPLLKGAKDCCDTYGTDLAGGDLDHHDELTLVSSGVGEVSRTHIVRRRGGTPGDLICVTGIPGRAQAALEGYQEFDRYLLEPRPRVKEGQILGTAGATSMMDLSDGLALSLYDLSLAGDVGFALDSRCIPRIPGIPADKGLECALFGGGDYELLFTCPAGMLPVEGVDATPIGSVTSKKEVSMDGAPLPRRGYQHSW